MILIRPASTKSNLSRPGTGSTRPPSATSSNSHLFQIMANRRFLTGIELKRWLQTGKWDKFGSCSLGSHGRGETMETMESRMICLNHGLID